MTVVDQPYDDHDDDDDDDGNDDTVDILRKSPYDGCRPTIWKGRVDCATVDVIFKIFDKIKIWFWDISSSAGRFYRNVELYLSNCS